MPTRRTTASDLRKRKGSGVRGVPSRASDCGSTVKIAVMVTFRRRLAEKAFGSRVDVAARAWRWGRRHSPWEPSRQLRVARRFVKRHGLTVQRGPFAGLRYVEAAIGATTLAPK